VKVTTVATRLAGPSRERLAERLTAACYGTVLALAALAPIHPDDVSSGIGWELVTGIGVATWIAHLYAEIVGDHVRHGSQVERHEIGRAMVDGLPILLAAVPPAVMLLLGRLDVLSERFALWAAVAIAFVQLVGVGLFVGSTVKDRGGKAWKYAALTIAIGVVIVSLKIAVGH
jgi:hypothetical protein